MVYFNYLTNPFNPNKGRISKTLPEKQTIWQIVKEQKIDLSHPTVCFVNEKAILRHNWSKTLADNRASLIASFGDIEKPGIIFSGHLDTTKIVEQEHLWEQAPLKMNVVDGCVFGKGSTDMKGAISVLLSQVEKLKILAKKYPIHFVLTHDEEGVFTAINQLKDNNFYNLFSLK